MSDQPDAIDLDREWYLAKYPDVAAAGIDPIEHYLTSGRAEGRRPRRPSVAHFDADWYLAHNSDVAAAGIDALEHYLTSGRDEGRLPGPPWDDPDDPDPRSLPNWSQSAGPIDIDFSNEIRGERQPFNAVRTLVVGHAAGSELFGAERSLIEVLDGFAAIGHDVVVTVPTQVNEGYIDELGARSLAVHIVPVPPRRPNEAADETLVDHWCRLIERHDIQAVHVNTIMPREPMLAAQRRNVPAVLHAHEVPFGDSALSSAMGATPQEIVANVVAEAGYVIGNSSITANAFDIPGRTSVVPNVVDISAFQTPAEREGPPRVALIGDATPKKGVREFARLAAALRDKVDARFVIVGPSSTALASLHDIDLPDNLDLVGYKRTPTEAIAEADIVINISRCRETFARTVLEGMAAGLPIVAYNRGALPLLVEHGRTGILVPFDDQEALANAVERLCLDPDLRREMGAAGRKVAASRFAPANLQRALNDTYRAILPSDETKRQRAHDIVVRIPSVNRTKFLQPFFAGYRARWANCPGVGFLDSTTLVAVSLLGQRLYTIQVDTDKREASIVSERTTVDSRGAVSCDLIDSDRSGRVLTSNGEGSSVSIYQHSDGALHLTTTVDLDNPSPGFVHGARFVPDHDDLIAACVTTGTPGVRFVSTTDGQQLFSAEFDGRAPKDVNFNGPHRMAVTLHRRLVETYPLEGLEGAIALCKVDVDKGTYETIIEIALPTGNLDGLCFHNDRLYASSSGEDTVMVFDTSGDQLRRLPDLEGFSLPHEPAVSPDGAWLAVACYGDGGVVLRSLGASS